MENNQINRTNNPKKATGKKIPNKNLFFIGFVLLSLIFAFIIGGIYLGENESSNQAIEFGHKK